MSKPTEASPIELHPSRRSPFKSPLGQGVVDVLSGSMWLFYVKPASQSWAFVVVGVPEITEGREDKDPIVLARNVRVFKVPVMRGKFTVAKPAAVEVTVGNPPKAIVPSQ